MATIGSLGVNILANTSGLTGGLKKARTEVALFAKSIDGLKAGLAGLGVGLSASALLSNLRRQAEEIDRLAKSADTLNIATDKFLGLSRAVELGGASQGSLVRGLSLMERQIADSSDKFRQLRLHVLQLKRLNPEFVFLKIADAVKSIPDAGARLQAVRDVFGKGGEELLPTLLGGSDQLRREMALHAGFTRLDARGVEDANDAVNRIKHSFDDLGQTLVVKLAPSMESLADTINHIVGGASFEKTTEVTGLLGKLSDAQFAQFRTAWSKASIPSVFGTDISHINVLRQFGLPTNLFRNEASIEAAIREREMKLLQEHQEGVANLTKGSPLAPRVSDLGRQQWGGVKSFWNSLFGGPQPANPFDDIRLDPERMKRGREQLGGVISLWNSLRGIFTGQPANPFDDPALVPRKTRGGPPVGGFQALEGGTAAAFAQARRSQIQEGGVDKEQLAELKKINKGIEKLADQKPEPAVEVVSI